MRSLVLVFLLIFLVSSCEGRNCSAQSSCSSCIDGQNELYPECVWCGADYSCRFADGHFQLPSVLRCVPNCRGENTLTLPGKIIFIVYLVLFGAAIIAVALRWLAKWCRRKCPPLYACFPSKRALRFGNTACSHRPLIETGARCQECIRNAYKEGESQFGTPDFPEKLPFFTTALSGGGIRAAAHSLGLITTLVEAFNNDQSPEKAEAMSAWESKQAENNTKQAENNRVNLNKQPFLGPIGIISSVSGGGYTATGLSAHLNADQPDKRSIRALQSLASAVVRSPNYLGGSGPLSSSGALKMVGAIFVRATMFLVEFATFSFLLGSLMTSLCSCGTEKDTCFTAHSGFLWICPNFLQSNGNDCPSAEHLAENSHLLFGLSREIAWICALVILAAIPPILCTSRHNTGVFPYIAIAFGILAGSALIAGLLCFYWDLCILMMYAVLQFQAATGNIPVFILILLGALLLALCSCVFTQANSVLFKLLGFVVLLPSLMFFVSGLPGYFGALTLCWLSETTRNWVLFGLALLAVLLLFFEVHILRDLLFRVYVGSLKSAFYPPNLGCSDRITQGPYLAINACVHGPPFTSFEKQDFDHFLMTPSFYGTESYSSTKKSWLYSWNEAKHFSTGKLAFAMGLSAAAVAPRAGRIEFPILVRSILALLDVSMGKWFTFTSNASIKDYSHSWIFDHIPLFFFYIAILSSYISFGLFGVGVIVWSALILWNYLIGIVPNSHSWFQIDNVNRIRELNCRQSVFFRRLAQGASLKSLPADPVYVADGGHFENLGLYYLVRRHAPIIFCSDAAQDTTNSDLFRTLSILKTHGFWFTTIDLQRKEVQVTKDVEIPVYQIIKYGYITPPEDGKVYHEYIGVIFIVKLAFPTHHTLPPDVRAYFSLQEGEQFSIDSTANQFFSPEQFRAYLEVAQSNTHELLEAILWASQTHADKGVRHDRATAFEVAELGGYGGMGAPGGFARAPPQIFVHIDDEEDQRASPAVGDQPQPGPPKNLIKEVWSFAKKVKDEHQRQPRALQPPERQPRALNPPVQQPAYPKDEDDSEDDSSHSKETTRLVGGADTTGLSRVGIE